MKIKSLLATLCLVICCHAVGQGKDFEGKMVIKTFTSISSKSPLAKALKVQNGADTKTIYIKGDSINIGSSASGMHTCYLGDRYICYNDNLKRGFNVPNVVIKVLERTRHEECTKSLTSEEQTVNGYNCLAEKHIINSSLDAGLQRINTILDVDLNITAVPYNIPSCIFADAMTANQINNDTTGNKNSLIVRSTLKTYLAANDGLTRSVMGDLGMFISAETKEISEMTVTAEQLLPPSDYKIDYYEEMPVSDSEKRSYDMLYLNLSSSFETKEDMIIYLSYAKLYSDIFYENQKYLKKQKQLVEPTKEVIVYEINDNWDY